jgi:aryl-alcohol dehydrogenase-like predicted oxidoreductase
MDDERRGARPEYIRQALDDSLRRLGTDRIDLYIQHEPDPGVPIGETLGALDELVRAGKIREIGCSNFSIEELREAEDAARRAGTVRFVNLQNEYSLLHREPERDVIPECERAGIAFVPFFPLASGLLTGKYHRGESAPAGSRLGESKHYAKLLTEENLARVEALREFAESRRRTLLELAFSWLLASPSVASVIAGATRTEQVASNAAAIGWRLTEAELEEINKIVPPAR